jgi:hypothetical protein
MRDRDQLNFAVESLHSVRELAGSVIFPNSRGGFAGGFCRLGDVVKVPSIHIGEPKG